MIDIDTSALMALLLGEPEADGIAALLGGHESLSISAGTLAEALIAAERRGVQVEMAQLIDGLHIDELGGAGAAAVGQAYSAWGKSVPPAGLNFGDCFAYAAAQTRGARLLFVGEDFAKRTSCRRCDVSSPAHTACQESNSAGSIIPALTRVP